MRKPANPGGVVFASAMAVLLLVGVLLLGPGETTRKGIPVWLLGVVGVPCFLWMAVQCWRRPRRRMSADARPGQ
jgi:hypothetical protein